MQLIASINSWLVSSIDSLVMASCVCVWMMRVAAWTGHTVGLTPQPFCEFIKRLQSFSRATRAASSCKVAFCKTLFAQTAFSFPPDHLKSALFSLPSFYLSLFLKSSSIDTIKLASDSFLFVLHEWKLDQRRWSCQCCHQNTHKIKSKCARGVQ